MPNGSLKLFTAAAGLAIVLLPLWSPPASADNGAEFNERRRNTGFMQQDRTYGWFGADDRRRQSRGNQRRRQPFQGWWQWQQQPSAGWWDPEPEPTRRAKRSVERNFEPEPETVQGAEIYDYRPGPLVALEEASLKWPVPERTAAEPGDRLVNVEPRPSAPEDPIAKAVFDQLVAGSAGVQVTEAQRKALAAFYVERRFAPAWFSEGDASQRSKPVLELLSRAAQEGLEPADYLPPSLGGFSDSLPDGSDREAAARFELGLSAMALRYAMHTSGGRIIPNRLSGYHDLNPPTVAPGEALHKLASEEAPQAYLASLHPTHPAYAALKAELAKLEPGDDGAAHVPIEDGVTVRPGDEDSRIPRIRARLAQLGQTFASDEIEVSSLEGTVVDPVAGEQPEFGSAEIAGAMGPEIVADSALVYDAELQSAVRAFQDQAGLKPDGLIGSRTIAALNAKNDIQHHRQVMFSMERLRWLPRDLGLKHVLVNPAAFTATVTENGARLWETKVIVGKPNTQTATFSDQIETVVLNPYWGVPGSIIVHEMLPYLKHDPSYLDREGYEVVNSAGTVVSSSNVNWWSMSKNRITVGVRQPPGPQNALGEIKFLFPNKHSIYMHDTPSKPLFDKAMRAYSHGCVRVENPRHFAELLLGWDQQRLDSELSGGANQSVKLDRKVPVHLAYFTAWPDAQGRVVYYNDVYGRDDRLELAFGTSRLAMR